MVFSSQMPFFLFYLQLFVLCLGYHDSNKQSGLQKKTEQENTIVCTAFFVDFGLMICVHKLYFHMKTVPLLLLFAVIVRRYSHKKIKRNRIHHTMSADSPCLTITDILCMYAPMYITVYITCAQVYVMDGPFVIKRMYDVRTIFFYSTEIIICVLRANRFFFLYDLIPIHLAACSFGRPLNLDFNVNHRTKENHLNNVHLYCTV